MGIIKTSFFFLILVSMAMGGIYVKSNVTAGGNTHRLAQIAPIIIGNNGTIRFPGRIPSAETMIRIQQAARTDNAQALNDLLVKHRFYVVPERQM